MAIVKGNGGLAKVSDNTVASVRNFSLDQSAETIDKTVMGNGSRRREASLTSATGTIDCYWDAADTNGQVALAVGSSVPLKLYPSGESVGDTYYSLTAIVTGEPVSSAFDGMVEASFSFESDGDVTKATVSA